MTGRRPSLGPSLGLAALLTAFVGTAPLGAAPSAAALPTTAGAKAPAAFLGLVPFAALPQGDLEQRFREGVALLRAGSKAEALEVFQAILASDPSNEEAYLLWKNTDQELWLDLLVADGQFELVAKHLMGQVRAERVMRQNDPDAIRALLSELDGADPVARARIVQTLSANHGEYAVPYLLAALADRGNDDRRVVAIQVLTRLGPDAVPPLLEALESPDEFLRRNVAATLGYLGDGRATGMLLRVASADGDEATRAAADRALVQMAARRDRSPAEVLVQEGRDYLARRDNVLSPALWSQVVWGMDGGRLVAREVPRLIFAEEMAKQCFYRALAADSSHGPALAGIAQATVAATARVADAAAAGDDVGDAADHVASGLLAALAAGPAALDGALAHAMAEGDSAGARGLVQVLARGGVTQTPALRAALSSEDAALAEEAALAIARVALHRRETVGQEVVQRLARAAGRQVVQAALVIDGDSLRAETLVSALRGRGMVVQRVGTGAEGLATLLRAPRMDAIFVAETLPDLTASQVVTEVSRNPAQAGSPVMLLAADAEAAQDLWGDRVSGALGADLDLATLDDAMGSNLGRDRELADDLARRAAETLLALHRAGADVSSARENLVQALSRPDAVALPALALLAGLADPEHTDTLVALVGDSGRSDALRLGAADALAGLFARHRAAPSAQALSQLSDLLRSEESLELRMAIASALGQLDLNPAMRAALVRDVRLVVGAQ